MTSYGSLADDYYVNLVLNTEMPLPSNRETVLDFMERVQRSYPTMANFYTRDNGDFVLEEGKDRGDQRWMVLEPRRVCSGCINPEDIDEALDQHKLVLELVPYMLSLKPLDCEALDYTLGFHFSYRGNHDALVAEALGSGVAFDGIADLPGAQILNYEPSIAFTLDEECRVQARIMVETRTSAYQVRHGDFPEDQISVYFAVRQYGSLPPGDTFEETLLKLRDHSEHLMETYVIDHVLTPLANAIAAR